VVLYYAFLPSRVLCWTLQAGREFRMIEVKATPDRLRTLVRTYRRLVESSGDAAALDRVSGQLYDLLLRPALDGVDPERQLLIVPDDQLHELTFAGLRDPQRSLYLIDRHPVAIGSSLRVLSAAARAASRPPPGTAAPRVLVVGSPQLAEGRGLPSLPDAAREAESIASLYPGARVVTGREATRERVLGQLENTEIFHYAGHAIANPRLPSLSRLLLASDRELPDPADGRDSAGSTDSADPRGPGLDVTLDDPDRLSGAVLANEVIPSLGRLRIVVLAACRTAEGTLYPGEGVSSVARPFLVAGVPVVIAGLWDVDDRGSRELFERFHRELSAGATVANALRAAQRSMAHDSDPRFTHARVWAAFESFGVPWVRAIARDR
jgi:CHAT domain-containing protein